MRDAAYQNLKKEIKDNIKTTLALFEIAGPWNPDKKLIEDLAEITAKDILKLVKEYERKRTKSPSKGLRNQGTSDACMEQRI